MAVHSRLLCSPGTFCSAFLKVTAHLHENCTLLISSTHRLCRCQLPEVGTRFINFVFDLLRLLGVADQSNFTGLPGRMTEPQMPAGHTKKPKRSRLRSWAFYAITSLAGKGGLELHAC